MRRNWQLSSPPMVIHDTYRAWSVCHGHVKPLYDSSTYYKVPQYNLTEGEGHPQGLSVVTRNTYSLHLGSTSITCLRAPDQVNTTYNSIRSKLKCGYPYRLGMKIVHLSMYQSINQWQCFASQGSCSKCCTGFFSPISCRYLVMLLPTLHSKIQ